MIRIGALSHVAAEAGAAVLLSPSPTAMLSGMLYRGDTMDNMRIAVLSLPGQSPPAEWAFDQPPHRLTSPGGSGGLDEFDEGRRTYHSRIGAEVAHPGVQFIERVGPQSDGDVELAAALEDTLR